MTDVDAHAADRPADGTAENGSAVPGTAADSDLTIGRPDTQRADPLPGLPWLFAGLTVAHAAAVASTLAEASGGAAALAAGVDAALAVLLLGATGATALRPPTTPWPAAVALGVAAVAGGVRATALGSVPAASTIALVALGAAFLAVPRAVAAVLATCAGAVAGAAAFVVTDGAPASSAVLTVGGVTAAIVMSAGLDRVLAQRSRVAELARESAQTLRVNDPLTGVLNRRGLDLVAEPLLEHARRRGEAVHALFVDVDGFSAVNLEAGYSSGDDVLVAVAEALRGAARQTDSVCRVGGDEFVVLGPGTGTSPLELERRVREILRTAPPVDESVWPFAVSIGSATLVPWDDGNLQSLVRRADQDMRLRRSLRRQNAERRGGLGTSRDAAPRTEV